MSDPLFTPLARQYLVGDDAAEMREFCESLHPATVAESLADDGLSAADVWRFLRTTSIGHQAEVFAYFEPEWQLRLVEGTGREAVAKLIEEMPSDDRAELMRELPRAVREQLLRLVDEADRRDIARLIQYPEDTAGALMTTEYAWLPADVTVDEALDRLRLQAPNAETIYTVYVVDDHRCLRGVVSLRDLIMSPRQAPLREVMETSVVSVRDTDDREKVAREFGEYDLMAMPVTDGDGRLVGIITSDDVLDVVVEEATEDAHRMGAVGPMAEDYLEASFLTIWRNRAFWLSMLFVAELFTFTALASFEDAIAQVVVLSLFVPLCISTGGNSGSQAATLITRAMALGQVTQQDWARVLRHEVLMGLALGLTLGVLGFLRASATPESVRSNSPPRFEPFTVTVPARAEMEVKVTKTKPWMWYVGLAKEVEQTEVSLPAAARQELTTDRGVVVELPEDEGLPDPDVDAWGDKVYTFPAKCVLRRPPVPRFGLALVIGLSVAGICLWGTLIGSMLPLVFRRMGIDPGIASSPFVATFVDVTGIVIYFKIAQLLLGSFMG
jgi:magnesium transporter